MDSPYLAQRDTVISQLPPSSLAGGMFFEISRPIAILPRVGSKWRDQVLRYFDRADWNGNWQGSRSGIVKKVANVAYEINGKPAIAQYYHDMLGYAHLGRGFEYLCKLAYTNFLTQSYGAIFEIAGPGDPSEPLMQAPTGLNCLDSLRCYVTGNRTYPILYYSLWDGKLHKMHASRVYMMVDDPNPDERFFGIGTSALERAIAVSQREIRMGQYVDALMDDKPQPGILSLSGVSDLNWQALVNKYMASTSDDELPTFGKTIVLTSIDPNAEVKVQVVPFSQTPEKFDFIKYTDENISAYALALGVDRQELWELAGRGLGSGSQSGILAMKSRAKLYNDLLSGVERMMNWAILPEELEFRFVEHDQLQDQVQSTIDLTYAQAAQALTAIGFKPEAVGRLLADVSQSYQEAFTNDQGEVTLDNFDKQTPLQIAQEVALTGNTPVAPVGNSPTPEAAVPPTNGPGSAQAGTTVNAKPSFGGQTKDKRHVSKAFGVTSADFRTRFTDILERTIQGRLRAAQAENLMLSLLLSSGSKAFSDGLMEGGVSDELDSDDEAQIQDIVTDAIDYLDPLLESAQKGEIAVDQASVRADMWSNKTLREFYQAGIISADRNGMYQWIYGDTDHCEDCSRLNGQVHRYSMWYSKGWLPGDTKLKCHGFKCQCKLIKTASPANGRF